MDGGTLERLGELDQGMRELYWKQKDVGGALEAGRRALALEDEARAAGEEALSKVKTVAYNVASFAWCGWDEPGIEISDEMAGEGLQAARLNLRLGRELSKPPLAMSRAHWMLGGHLLTAGDASGAMEEFRSGLAAAVAAGEEGDIAMCRASLALAEVLVGGPDLIPKLTTTLAELADAPEGEAYVQQVNALMRVLGMPALGQTDGGGS